MGLTAAQRRDIVSDVIDLLQLDAVKDNVVGSPGARGISGGQRKRVNLGLEIAAKPSMLFLDEPTSGLDATAATIGILRGGLRGAVLHLWGLWVWLIKAMTSCLFDRVEACTVNWKPSKVLPTLTIRLLFFRLEAAVSAGPVAVAVAIV